MTHTMESPSLSLHHQSPLGSRYLLPKCLVTHTSHEWYRYVSQSFYILRRILRTRSGALNKLKSINREMNSELWWNSRVNSRHLRQWHPPFFNVTLLEFTAICHSFPATGNWKIVPSCNAQLVTPFARLNKQMNGTEWSNTFKYNSWNMSSCEIFISIMRTPMSFVRHLFAKVEVLMPPFCRRYFYSCSSIVYSMSATEVSASMMLLKLMKYVKIKQLNLIDFAPRATRYTLSIVELELYLFNPI